MDEVVFFLLWLVFLPLIVGDGGMVGWILFLQNISGKALFSICSVRMAWVHLACGWDSSRWVISSEKVLMAFLCELVLCWSFWDWRFHIHGRRRWRWGQIKGADS